MSLLRRLPAGRARARAAALPGALLSAAVVLTACSTGATGGSDDGAEGGTTAAAEAGADASAFPVTIEHAFGETTIEELPERVATVAWVNADVALALGVVPVGMPADEWGGNDQRSTPWKDAALEAAGAAIGTDAAPVQYSEADGIPYEDIAAVTPDVILAAYSGLTREEYDKLTQIAPVVAYPEVAYGTPWQDTTRIIGEALGRSERAEEVVAETEALLAEQAAEHPELAGRSFIYGNLEPGTGGPVSLYTAEDNRSRLLTALGMEQAPVVDQAAAGASGFFVEWAPERANELTSDVFVTWLPEGTTAAQVQADPLLGQIPAVAGGRLVTSADDTLTLAISASSPLSLPWALDEVLPPLAEAAAKAS